MERISTQQLHRQGINGILQNQVAVARLQAQMATGARVQTAADDPAAMAKIMNIDSALSDIGQWQSNIGTVQDRLGLEENALNALNDVIDRVRQLGVQARSSALSDSDRNSIAAEMKELSATLLSTANSRDSQGRYLFAGSRDGQAPFVRTSSGVQYRGDDTVSTLQVGASRQIGLGDSGADVFMRLRAGTGAASVSAASSNTGLAYVTSVDLTDAAAWSGGSYRLSFSGGNYEVTDAGGTVVSSGAYESGSAVAFGGLSISLDGEPADGDSFSVGPAPTQDLFSTIDQITRLVNLDDQSAAQSAQNQTAFFDALSALSAAQDHLGDVRGSVGSRLGAADDASAQLGDRKLQLDSLRSGLHDLDYTQAAADLSAKQTALAAAQQTYISIQKLSLFDYL